MMPNRDPDEAARAEALEALPAVFTFLRGFVSVTRGCKESEELRSLIEACVVEAHRLRLASLLRTKGAFEHP